MSTLKKVIVANGLVTTILGAVSMLAAITVLIGLATGMNRHIIFIVLWIGIGLMSYVVFRPRKKPHLKP